MNGLIPPSFNIWFPVLELSPEAALSSKRFCDLLLFIISFKKVIFLIFFRRLAHLFLSLFYLSQFSLVRFCLNLVLKRDLPIIAFRRSLFTKSHGPQTQLRVECALRLSKLMTRLHFPQLLWNVTFLKCLDQALPY